MGWNRCGLHAQRQAGHRLRDNPDAGVHRGKLNGRLRGDGFPGAAGAEVEHGRGADAVLGLVPRTEQPGKGIFHSVLLKFRFLMTL